MNKHMEPRKREPKVSVLMLAYNHEPYIAQAIESVLQQVTDFDVELVIGDDCSSDCTAAVASRYRKEFPEKIFLRSSTKNEGMYRNFVQLYSQCRGEYIALLEADDFWLCPRKLQKQIDYLDSNRDCALSFHPVHLANANGAITENIFPSITSPKKLLFRDLLEENCIPTCSVVFRRSSLNQVPQWCEQSRILDWPLFLVLASRGSADLIPETLAAYRIHSNGAWSQLAPHAKSQRMIEVLKLVSANLHDPVCKDVPNRIVRLYEHISWCHEETGAFHAAALASWDAFQHSTSNGGRFLKNYFRLRLKSQFSDFRNAGLLPLFTRAKNNSGRPAVSHVLDRN